MLKTIRTEQVGKVTLRLLKSDEGYVAAIIGGKPIPHLHGDDPDELWAKLRAEVGKASPHYFGFDGARARFLRLFPDGFAGEAFCRHERDYKLTASDFLNKTLPLHRALSAEASDCEAAMKAYGKTNLLSTFEHARTREVLKSSVGPQFVRAAARLASGEDGTALSEIQQLFTSFGTASWPAATYLPFLWRPAENMFLKPEVTRDFAERVGHPFAQAYGAQLQADVYRTLLALARETAESLKDLEPRDYIDVQSFIWIVGAYDGGDAPEPVEAS